MINSPYFFDAGLPELAASAGDILANCTIYPWVIIVRYVDSQGRLQIVRHIVESSLVNEPIGADLVPDGALQPHVHTFPATFFDDMSTEGRIRYRQEYKAFLMWRRAKALGKAVADLAPWADFDPIHIDESVERWVKPVGRCAGD